MVQLGKAAGKRSALERGGVVIRSPTLENNLVGEVICKGLRQGNQLGEVGKGKVWERLFFSLRSYDYNFIAVERLGRALNRDRE